MTARLDPRHVGYDQAKMIAFYDELDRRLRAVPGVESSSQAFTVPLSYLIGDGSEIEAEGSVAPAGEPRPTVGYNSVSPSYFDTLRLPLVRGRAFTDQDNGSSTLVAIVDETLAARLWPKQDPVGKRFTIADLGGRLWQVVGVAHDSKFIAVFEGALPRFYVPLAQATSSMRALLIRSALAPNALAVAVRREVAAIDPDMPLAEVSAMEETVAGNMGVMLLRVGAVEAAWLGLIGLLLAVVGVYGVVSYGASQRTREIGIRLALGADPRDVRHLVLREGTALVAAGVALGLFATIAATRTMRTLLVLVSANDPLTFLLVTSLLIGVALVACYLPARRAMRVDPMIALRSE